MRRAYLPLCLLLASVLAGCGGASSPATSNQTGTSVSVNPAAASLIVGGALQLRAVATSNATGQSTTATGSWSSSDEGVVEVNSNGFLLATGEGIATVTFLCSSCQPIEIPVTVTPRAFSLTVSPINATVLSGGSLQLAAAGLVDGKQQDVTNLATWSLNNSLAGAATITEGLLAIGPPGVTTQTIIVVTASFGGLQASAPVFVKP